MSALFVVFAVAGAEYALPASSRAAAGAVPGRHAGTGHSGLRRGHRAGPRSRDPGHRPEPALRPPGADADLRYAHRGHGAERPASGALVEKSREVLRIEPASLQATPGVIEENSRGFVEGLAQIGARTLMLISLSKVIGEDELNVESPKHLEPGSTGVLELPGAVAAGVARKRWRCSSRALKRRSGGWFRRATRAPPSAGKPGRRSSRSLPLCSRPRARFQDLAADQATVSTATSTLQKGGEEANAGLRELAASIGAVRTGTAALVGSAESLTEVVGRTSRSAKGVSANAEELAAASEELQATISGSATTLADMAQRGTGEAATIEEVAATIEEMSKGIGRLAKDADAVSAKIEGRRGLGCGAGESLGATSRGATENGRLRRLGGGRGRAVVARGQGPGRGQQSDRGLERGDRRDAGGDRRFGRGGGRDVSQELERDRRQRGVDRAARALRSAGGAEHQGDQRIRRIERQRVEATRGERAPDRDARRGRAQPRRTGGSERQGGRATVAKSIRGLGTMRTAIESSAAVMQEMGKRAEQIGDIVQTINLIADRTNLLSLNASIEAARAGNTAGASRSLRKRSGSWRTAPRPPARTSRRSSASCRTPRARPRRAPPATCASPTTACGSPTTPRWR